MHRLLETTQRETKKKNRIKKNKRGTLLFYLIWFCFCRWIFKSQDGAYKLLVGWWAGRRFSLSCSLLYLYLYLSVFLSFCLCVCVSVSVSWSVSIGNRCLRCSDGWLLDRWESVVTWLNESFFSQWRLPLVKSLFLLVDKEAFISLPASDLVLQSFINDACAARFYPLSPLHNDEMQ